MSFQMSEQHLDLFTSPSALIVLPCVLQLADGMPCIFIQMPRDRSKWRVGAGFADRTRATCFLTRVASLHAVIFLDAPHRHLMAFEAGVGDLWECDPRSGTGKTGSPVSPGAPSLFDLPAL